MAIASCNASRNGLQSPLVQCLSQQGSNALFLSLSPVTSEGDNVPPTFGKSFDLKLCKTFGKSFDLKLCETFGIRACAVALGPLFYWSFAFRPLTSTFNLWQELCSVALWTFACPLP